MGRNNAHIAVGLLGFLNMNANCELSSTGSAARRVLSPIRSGLQSELCVCAVILVAVYPLIVSTGKTFQYFISKRNEKTKI